MAGFVRWRPEMAVILIHPETGEPVTAVRDRVYRDDDPLVVKFRWAFVSNEEEFEEAKTARLAARRLRPEDIAARADIEAPVERATKAPGEKRATKKKKTTKETSE